MKRIFPYVTAIALIAAVWSTVLAEIRCDINNNGRIGLEEAVYALQVVGGLKPLNYLEGAWVGLADGSGGPSTVTMILNADSTMTVWGNTEFYHQLSGSWSISGSQFLATATDGTLTVTYSGAITDNVISGTWSGSNQTSGTFSTIRY